MYSTLLNSVVNLINENVGKDPEEDFVDDMMTMMFNPTLHKQREVERKVRKDRANKLIIGATAVATIGELYHIAKQSGVIEKLTKK